MSSKFTNNYAWTEIVVTVSDFIGKYCNFCRIWGFISP